MRKSDFFKHLYLAAVSSGQITATSTSASAVGVMQSLMSRYLDASQNLGRVTRLAKSRAAQDPPFVDQRGGGLSS